ncbi:proteophosphoglycan ppg4 [Rhodotorula toruloides]|uniref:Proteophosphoglycan ppg4 n=1 Tax=Rhodotorula toruloides TaxID=5286 RepID=A0A511KM33_RHOTO|nr:proteophosphoglycan ppg4 [Rhodotorula toruloides]
MSPSDDYATNALRLSSSKPWISPFPSNSMSNRGNVASEAHFLSVNAQASTSSGPASSSKAVPVFVLPAPTSSPPVTGMPPSDVLGASDGADRAGRSSTVSLLPSFHAAVAKLKESTASPKPVKTASPPRRRSMRAKMATAAASAKQAPVLRNKKEPLFLPDPASPGSTRFRNLTGLPAAPEIPDTPPTPISPAPKRKGARASKPGHIPRPRNSFMIYRSAQIKTLSDFVTPSGQRLPQSDLSRMIASMWRDETLEVRKRYARQAEEEKAEHYRRHPDYRYQPSVSRKKANDHKLPDLGKSTMVFPPSPSASVSSSGIATPSVLLPPRSMGISNDSAGATTPTSQFLSPFTPPMACDSLPTPSSSASEAWSIFRSTPITWMEAPVNTEASWPLATCERRAPADIAQPAYLDFSFALTPPFDTFISDVDDFSGNMALPTPPLAFEEAVGDNLVDQWLAVPHSFDSLSTEQHFPLSPALTPTLDGSPRDQFTLLAH